MSYYKYGLSADPSFQMGMALGNAYGNLWASNAKKRNEAQMDEVVNQYLDDQRMQQLANPIEEKPLITEAINSNYTSDNTNGINNNALGIQKYNRSYGLATPQSIIDEAKRRGIHQEVIDEKMKGVREQIASKAKATMMPQINQLIYGTTDANGNYVAPTNEDYLKAIGLIDNYRKYDTTGADELSKTLNNRQLGQLEHLANRQQTLDDYRFRQANGMVEGRPQYRISDNAYNSALKANQDLISLGVKLTPEQQEFYDANAQVVNAWRAERGLGLGNFTQPQQSEQNNVVEFNPENWESVLENIKIAKATKNKDGNIPTTEEIYNRLVAMNVKGDILKRAKNYLRYKTPEDIKAEEEENLNILFPKDDKGNIKGLENTVRPNEEVMTALKYGKPLWNLAHR